jgi:hypothetical protein
LPLMMTTSDPYYSANVRAEVARAGRTQQAVFDAIGMTRSQWERRMRGDVDWRAIELHRIAEVLDIPVDRLTSR